MKILERLGSFWQIVTTRLWIVGRLFKFLWQNKMWWLIPMISVLVVFFALILFAQSTPLGPFIYTLF